MTETPWESPAEDVAEQRAEVLPSAEEPRTPTPAATALRWDVDPADAAEQEAEVPIDDEEWR
jgi:hypothetical protein